MAPKSTQATGKAKLIGDEDEVLQAIILADSFNKRFKPLTTNKPRCLLPICNAPLLEWTFESLALAGVQEIFVICRSHASQVKAAIRDSKWSKPGSGIKIQAIMTAKETYSPGDAMRDVYTRGLVTSDFVLVAGDLVSNVRIDEVVRVHKERRKANKDAIMTMVVMESGASHRTRSTGDSSIFVLDAETSECLHYEPVTGHPRKDVVRIPRELLSEHPEMDIRNDLIDCCIDVCSAEVPSLFQDNFDYLDLRRDFVHGVLTSDLLMKNIYCYVVKEGYAARVKDTKSYDAISKDILSRWTFPLVPDDNHPGGHEYEHLRGNKYIAKGDTVTLSRTCKIGNNTLIGAETQVYDNAVVTGSVIGQHCTIGIGTVIKNAYIFDGTDIGSNCVIEQSIVGAGVTIGDKTIIQRGCLIGDCVVVGPDAKLEPFERLSAKIEDSSDEEEESRSNSPADDDDEHEKDEEEEEEEEEDNVVEDVETDSDIEELEKIDQSKFAASLGKESNALVWPRGPITEDDEDEDDGPESFANQKFMRIGDTGSDLSSSDPGSDSDDDSSSTSSGDFGNEDSMDTSLLLDASGNEFISEVKLSLERAFAENHSVDNAAVELKTLRMASNVSLTKVREAVVSAIVEKILIIEGNPVEQRKAIASVISRWGELINKIGGVSGVETVSILQAHCASSIRFPLFGQILISLYQDDFVEEDDIRTWHALPASKGADGLASDEKDKFKKCLLIGAKMIAQFDEQESDEESGDDDLPAKATGAQEQNEPEEESSEEEDQPVAAAAKASDAQEQNESEEESSEEEEQPAVAAAKASGVQEQNKSGEESSEEEDQPAVAVAKLVPQPTAQESTDEEDEDEDEESSSSEEEATKAKISSHPTESAQSTTTPSTREESISGDDSEEDSSEETSNQHASRTIEVAKPVNTVSSKTSETTKPATHADISSEDDSSEGTTDDSEDGE